MKRRFLAFRTRLVAVVESRRSRCLWYCLPLVSVCMYACNGLKLCLSLEQCSTLLCTHCRPHNCFVLACTASVCGALGQTAGLPLFIASFASPKGLSTGVYFVVFFASCLFNVVFWPVVLFQSYVSHTRTAMCERGDVGG